METILRYVQDNWFLRVLSPHDSFFNSSIRANHKTESFFTRLNTVFNTLLCTMKQTWRTFTQNNQLSATTSLFTTNFFTKTFVKTESMFIDELLSDKQKFDAYVYTRPCDILKKMNERETCQSITRHISTIYPEKLPFDFFQKKHAVLVRSLATPNHEMYNFNAFCDSHKEFCPVIFEHTKDKYVNVNEMKFSLGKLGFYKGVNIHKEPIVQYKTILDMNKCDGKLIRDVHTTFGTTLKEFHTEFLLQYYPTLKGRVFEISDWLYNFGKTAHDYYEAFLSLFLKNAVLMETFLFTDEEMPFNREVVLPTILSIERKTGHKPIILPLETERGVWQGFYESYPHTSIDFVTQKLG